MEDRDRTDPDIFLPRPTDQDDTVPRCITCGKRQDTPDPDEQFRSGMDYALRGVHWILSRHPALSKADADQLGLWLRQGVTGTGQ